MDIATRCAQICTALRAAGLPHTVRTSPTGTSYLLVDPGGRFSAYSPLLLRIAGHRPSRRDRYLPRTPVDLHVGPGQLSATEAVLVLAHLFDFTHLPHAAADDATMFDAVLSANASLRAAAQRKRRAAVKYDAAWWLNQLAELAGVPAEVAPANDGSVATSLPERDPTVPAPSASADAR
jgi:hypothetical protein